MALHFIYATGCSVSGERPGFFCLIERGHRPFALCWSLAGASCRRPPSPVRLDCLAMENMSIHEKLRTRAAGVALDTHDQ